MEPVPASTSLSAGNEVLVVEDEVRVRDMLSRALKEMGFHSTLAPTAEAAFKLLADRSFDIVILDLNLPGMDGMEFLKRFRTRNNHAEVIILTGFGNLETARTAIHLDVVDFITKPYALGTLEVALDRARKRIRARNISQGIEGNPPEGEAIPREIPPVFEGPSSQGEALEELERKQILRVLQMHNGNRAATANELGISLRKLYYRLGEYERKGLMP